MHQLKDVCHQRYILNRNKRSYDTEYRCVYLISLDLAKSPFEKSSEVPDLAKTKVLELSP